MTEATIYFTEGADGLTGGERLVVIGEDAAVVRDVLAELARARAKFPDQHIPDGTGGPVAVAVGGLLKALCQANGPERDTWMNVIAEEVGEAFAETDWNLLRPELVQCAAMFARWILDGDTRDNGETAGQLSLFPAEWVPYEEAAD